MGGLGPSSPNPVIVITVSVIVTVIVTVTIMVTIIVIDSEKGELRH